MKTGRSIIKTFAEYSTPNDVKTGAFSPDGRQFAAAYHYGHAGAYTWVGIWSLPSGRFVRSKTISGWTTDIAPVFRSKLRATQAYQNDSLALHLDGKRVRRGGAGIKVLSGTGERLATFPVSSPERVAFSQDGKFVVTVSRAATQYSMKFSSGGAKVEMVLL